jgi:thioredoxin-like negative regulator of GroEL
MQLSSAGEGERALEVVDGAIKELVKEGEASSVVTLCHHAAILAGFGSSPSRVKHYYQQSLAVDPENSRALYGLAKVALQQGEPDTARQYAIRCHAALQRNDDSVIKRGLLELLGNHWPDVVTS